jgi:spoIIIJ-associated protein
MGVKAEIRINEDNDTIKISLTGPDMGILIGYRGETLDSLQYLVSLVINKGHETSYKRVVLDTENYRSKREETLKRLAQKVANTVRRTGKIIRLEPMNPYERRIIHSALQEDRYVQTFSEGEEPYRRVVIDIKKA